MELFQSYFIFWKFLFETRVIELRVRVKQNTKINVFLGYALGEPELLLLSLLYSISKALHNFTVAETISVNRELLFVKLFFIQA